jgi:hypothetical protein
VFLLVVLPISVFGGRAWLNVREGGVEAARKGGVVVKKREGRLADEILTPVVSGISQ